MGGTKNNYYGNDSCPSKLRSQYSAENLAGTQGKFEGKSLLYVNKGNINESKDEVIGRVGCRGYNNCMLVENSSAHHCGCVAYGSLAMAVCCQ